MADRPRKYTVSLAHPRWGYTVNIKSRNTFEDLFGPGKDGHTDGLEGPPLFMPSALTAEDLNRNTEEVCQFVERTTQLGTPLSASNYDQMTESFLEFIDSLAINNVFYVGMFPTASGDQIHTLWSDPDSEMIIAAGDAGVYLSFNGGAFFQTGTLSSAAIISLVEFNTANGVGMISRFANSLTYRTQDGGFTWGSTSIASPVFLADDLEWIGIGLNRIAEYPASGSTTANYNHLNTQVDPGTTNPRIYHWFAESPAPISVICGNIEPGTAQASIWQTQNRSVAGSWTHVALFSNYIAEQSEIAYGNGIFFTVFTNDTTDDHAVAIRNDVGGTWDTYEGGDSPLYRRFRDGAQIHVRFQDGYFYAWGEGYPTLSFSGFKIYRSLDGLTWVELPLKSRFQIDHFAVHEKGIFGISNEIATESHFYRTMRKPITA